MRWDFSTNANAAGPCPGALRAVQQADPRRYPDPTYQALREGLADWHGVSPGRILLAASASEFIQRITAVSGRLAPGPVAIPSHAYGDYAAAAQACERGTVQDLPTTPAGMAPPDAPQARGGLWGDSPPAQAAAPSLRWCTDPGSPLGQPQPPPLDLQAVTTVLDCAYAPLRLKGASPWAPDALDQVYQLFSPNKALGLTGVRGAYAVAPAQDDRGWTDALRAAEPSWPLGAHAVALLTAWTARANQAWLEGSLALLRGWTCQLRAGLEALGLCPQASVTPFLCAERPPQATAEWLHRRGLAVRCTASFGLPGGMRVAAKPPAATAALLAALHEAMAAGPTSAAAQAVATLPVTSPAAETCPASLPAAPADSPSAPLSPTPIATDEPDPAP